MKLEVKNRMELKGVPSASGIEYFDDTFYIVGDNSAWLHVFDKSLVDGRHYRIYEHETASTDTIPKVLKPDFEATTIVAGEKQNYLFVFGSGSKDPYRNVLVRVNLQNPDDYKLFSLHNFYAALKTGGVETINIEGAVYAKDSIFLFNRADNQMIQFSATDFHDFLNNAGSVPEFSLYKFNLPSRDSVQAGFSGACLIPETSQIVFSASLERTSNWVDDGSILGSYVGIIDLNHLSAVNEVALLPLVWEKETLAVKVESVAVVSQKKSAVRLVMVTDSDGGASEFIEAVLVF